MQIIRLCNKLYDKMLWKMHSNTQHSIMHTCANKTTRYTDEDRNWGIWKVLHIPPIAFSCQDEGVMLWRWKWGTMQGDGEVGCILNDYWGVIAHCAGHAEKMARKFEFPFRTKLAQISLIKGLKGLSQWSLHLFRPPPYAPTPPNHNYKKKSFKCLSFPFLSTITTTNETISSHVRKLYFQATLQQA